MSRTSQSHWNPSPRSTRSDTATANYGTVAGWQLVRPIGEGAMSRVFLARPEGCPSDWPSDYVVKTIKSACRDDPRARDAIRREAYIGKRVSHQHLMPILTSATEQPPYHVVMPRLNGATLEAVLDRSKTLTIPSALWYARQVAEALSALHKAGWVHGDVKPANILVSAAGHVTLFDLGLAHHQEDPAPHGSRPLVGTFQYLSPEAFVESRYPDHRSDIYSMGVTLFEMLSGHVPFEDDDPIQLIKAHRERLPPNLRNYLPHLPRNVSRLVEQILAKEPLRRPQTAVELVNRFVQLEIETFAMRAGG